MKIILNEKRPQGKGYKTKILMDTEAEGALNDIIDTRLNAKLKTYGLPVDNDEEMYELFRHLRKTRAGFKIAWEQVIKQIAGIIVAIIGTYFIVKKVD